MSDYPNERDCEHGHKRGKCEVCDREAEIADLKRELAEARTENAALNVALFHVENGLSHPDPEIRKLIEAALKCNIAVRGAAEPRTLDGLVGQTESKGG